MPQLPHLTAEVDTSRDALRVVQVHLQQDQNEKPTDTFHPLLAHDANLRHSHAPRWVSRAAAAAAALHPNPSAAAGIS